MKSKLKGIIIIVLSIFFASNIFAFDKVEYQLSTHVLDISRGEPATNIKVILYKFNNNSNTWLKIATAYTEKNGRIGNFLPKNQNNNGIYKLEFYTEQYFKSEGLKSIYPHIDVVFSINGTTHYHIPIAVSANGYSTYRGS